MHYIKTPYYPNKQLYIMKSPFGAVMVVSEKDIYDKPLQGKTIVKVDAVKYLEDLWGTAAVRNRDLAFRLVSGDCSNDLYVQTIISMYKRFMDFSKYIDTQWRFGDKSLTDITRIIKPARDHVDKAILDIQALIEATGGKQLLVTHDYVYACYTHNNIPEIKHSEVIKC